MKKSIKILALILTLALVCGVFIIGAFAAEETQIGYDYANRETVTGESVITWMDYEQGGFPALGSAANFTSTSGPETQIRGGNNKMCAFFYAQRMGDVSIASATKGAENHYLQIDMTKESEYKANSGPYADFDWNGLSSATSAFANEKPLSQFKYVTFDLDVYFPKTLSGNPSVSFHTRAFDKNGGRGFTDAVGYPYADRLPTWTFKTTTEGDYAVVDNDRISLLAADGWSHCTFVLETVETDDGYLEFNMYTIVNGILTSAPTRDAEGNVTASDVTLEKKDASLWYNGDTKGVFFDEIRIGFGNATDGTQILWDNAALRTFDTTYEGNLTELLAQPIGTDVTEWDANTYDFFALPYGDTVATIEDAEYDSLKKAVYYAEEDAIITLTKSTVDKVVVDKAITIDGTDAGYTCNIVAGEGFGISRVGNAYVVEPSTDVLTVYWYSCECGCYEEAEVGVALGNNIYEAYKTQVGYYPVCSIDEVDPETHATKKHAGFVEANGAVEFTEDLVVTEDLLGQAIELVPDYDEEYPFAVNVTKNIYYYPSKSNFKNIFSGASANNTVKLLDDVEISSTGGVGTYVTVSNNMTLDLNGKRIVCIQPASETKSYLISAGAKTLNVCSTATDSVAAIYHAKYTGSAYQGNPIFSTATNGTLNFVGRDADGNTTIRVYTAVLCCSWDATGNYNFDGGEFYRTASDHMGLFYFRSNGTGTIKNAYIYAADTAFCFGGVGNKTSTYTIDNCVINATEVSKCAFDELTVTFTNCFIGGKMTANELFSTAYGVTAATKPTHFIGEGCYIKDASLINADGVAYLGTKYDVNYTGTVIDNRNDFKAADKFATTATEIQTTYTTFVGPEGLTEIEVIWVDTNGEELGRTSAFPGLSATAPATPVAETNGMVMQTYTDWVGGTYIPMDAEDGYTITLAEDSRVSYSAGKVDVKFNFELVHHYQYNFYIPEAPAGIAYTGVIRDGLTPIAIGSLDYTDENGVRYSRANAWPGGAYVDKNYVLSLTYTWNDMEFRYDAPAINIAKYVNYILTDEKYATYDELKTMFADMLRSVEQVNIAAGQTTDTAFKAVLASAEKYMTDVTTMYDTTVTTDLTPVADYISDIKMVYTGLGGVTVKVVAQSGYGVMFSTRTYVHGYPTFNQTRQLAQGSADYYAHNVRTYAFAQPITVDIYNSADLTYNGGTISVKSGAEAVDSFTFSILGIINADRDTYSDADIAFIDSAMALAYSSYEYMDWRSVNLGVK